MTYGCRPRAGGASEPAAARDGPPRARAFRASGRCKSPALSRASSACPERRPRHLLHPASRRRHGKSPVWLTRNVTIEGWPPPGGANGRAAGGANGTAGGASGGWPTAPRVLDFNFTDSLQLVVGHGRTLTIRGLAIANLRRRYRLGFDALEGEGARQRARRAARGRRVLRALGSACEPAPTRRRLSRSI